MRAFLWFGIIFFGLFLTFLAGALLLGLPVYPAMSVYSTLPAEIPVKEGKHLDVLLLSQEESFLQSRAKIEIVVEWKGGGAVRGKNVNYTVLSDDHRYGKLFGYAVLRISPDRTGEVRIQIKDNAPAGVRVATQQPLFASFVTLGFIAAAAGSLSAWIVLHKARKRGQQQPSAK